MKSEKHLVESKRHLNVYITQENDKVERNKWKKILRLKKWMKSLKLRLKESITDLTIPKSYRKSLLW